MEQDASKEGRVRGQSIATANGHPPQATNTEGGSVANKQVNESRSHNSLGIHLDPPDYGIEARRDNAVGNPLPRHQHPYSNQPERLPRSTTRETVPSWEPPVTKATLSELDVNKIVNNPKLRHDINFDPDLHFRPNLDGEKGRRKTQKANDFWDTMRRQLRDFQTHGEQFEQELGTAKWCLPATLEGIRGILETLVPQRDRSSVEESFNVDLLMQEFRYGVANLVEKAEWLSELLKKHCAPMRDIWVDEMVTQLSKGHRERDVTSLVGGMQSLLGVLEAMKLDVANHQIRCLRPLLIEDTVHFEQKFFMKKIALGRVDIAGAHAWFRRASSLPEVPALDTVMHSQGNTWDFMKALVNLTLPSKSSEMVPHTFLFDEERLIKLRSDTLDLINLEICMCLYRVLEASSRPQPARHTPLDGTPSTSFVNSPCDRPASPADLSGLSSPTIPSTHHFSAPKQKQDQARGQLIRQYSGRQDFSPMGEDGQFGSSTSSPRSSPSSLASTPETYPTPIYLSQPLLDSGAQVRSSLIAILSSSPTNDKWTSLSSSLALQILRSTTTSLTNLPQFEYHLAVHLSNPGSSVYKEAESSVLDQLFPELHKLVENYTPLTSLQIFEAATTPKVGLVNTANPPTGQKEEISEIATRLAHIGILHWKVWAPLAYLVDPDAEDDNEMMTEDTGS